MNGRHWTGATLWAVLSWFCGVGSGADVPALVPARPLVFNAVRFGVPIEVQLYASDPAAAKIAAEQAFEEVRRFDRVFSDYDPDSEARRLCDRPVGVKHRVSSELFEVLALSQQFSETSGGEFDVTVGQLTRLWRKSRRFKRLPDARDLSLARIATGFGNLELVKSPKHGPPRPRGIVLAEPGMRLDFGGVVKGYALHRVAEVLRPVSRQYLIEFGGEVLVGDPPPGRDGWRIKVERPRLPDGTDAREPVLLTLREMAVATSGDTYQHSVIEGRRLSHIIDPRTGWPVESQPQVTVIARHPAYADAVASALSVMGQESGLDWIDQRTEAGERRFGFAARFESDGVAVVSELWDTLSQPRAARGVPDRN